MDSTLKLLFLLAFVPASFPAIARADLEKSNGIVIDKFVSLINGVVPNSPLGERTEFKEIASNDHTNEDLYDASAQEIIGAAGFQSVTHKVTTSDGYITELVNIVNPLADRTHLKGPPVVMFHGAMIDINCFLWTSIRQHHPEVYPRNLREDGPITSSNRSLAFMLANNGYDVWLASSRGSNRHNIGHTHYKTQLLDDLLPQLWNQPTAELVRRIIDTIKYFDYSQDQLVEIEYPRQIDEVLRLTGSERVSVVTYSKSSHIIMKLLASDGVHARRIHSHITLAPVLNIKGASNLWKMITNLAMVLPNPVGNLIFTQIFMSALTRRIMAMLPRYTVAWFMTTLLGGPSPRYQSFLETPLIGHVFMPVSFTEIKHYCQQVIVGKLQKYDHGPIINRHVYNGSATPPEYDISNIKLKRWMMVSADMDVLGTRDAANTYQKLHKHKPDPWIELHHSNHVDVTASFEHDVKVNLPALEFMDKYRIIADRISN